MQFKLGFISVALGVASLAKALPAEVSNTGINIYDFKENQLALIEMKDTFEAFHWKYERDNSVVDREFLFELKEPAEFQITDFLKGGDVYEVFDNGVSIGKTTELDFVASNNFFYAATPEEALYNTRFSQASYPLDAGVHLINIAVVDSTNESGTGAVRVIPKVQL